MKAGTTISVEDAIKGIVTRSANDAAVVVAEAIAGDEEKFAQLMTRKARALGMSRTVYKNASGLPDDEQVTSARDQAVLGRAVQERFPQYYKYFSLRSFTFRGQLIGNHNRLLGRVEGVDGIKTGYIRSSGFNLVSSVRRGNRHIVAVVMGGSSASSRDARMRELIKRNIDSASNKRAAPRSRPSRSRRARSRRRPPSRRRRLPKPSKARSEAGGESQIRAALCGGERSQRAGARHLRRRSAAGRDRIDRADQAGAGAHHIGPQPPPAQPAAPANAGSQLYVAALQPIELAAGADDGRAAGRRRCQADRAGACGCRDPE